MRVLVACKAFRERGYEAYSCDTQPCSGGHPEWHIQDDVLLHLEDGWDMMIAHPPCTYLTNVQMPNYSKKGVPVEKIKEAVSFFWLLWNADIEKICIENPRPNRYAKDLGLPKYHHLVEQNWFGDPYSKPLCLWLKNLPPLMSTIQTPERIKGWHDSHFGNSKARSKTFPGIANAMAEQWG